MLCMAGVDPAQRQRDRSDDISSAQSALKLDWKVSVCPVVIRRIQLKKNRPEDMNDR